MIRIGSLFSGIGGFELGLERAIPNSQTIWQVEQDKFCQKILKKHWPEAIIYDDVRNINKNNVESIDILCGGLPCQDICIAGNGKGIIKNETRSGLWWEMHRIIDELGPRIAIMENVPAITFRGGWDVVGSLAKIGYDCEWTIISARDFGACHVRERWFCVAYPNSNRKAIQEKERTSDIIGKGKPTATHTDNQGWIESTIHYSGCHNIQSNVANTDSERLQQTTIKRTIQIDDNWAEIQQRTSQKQNATNTNGQSTIFESMHPSTMEKEIATQKRMSIGCDNSDRQQYSTGAGHWATAHPEPLIRRVDDGVSRKLDSPRLKALGNSIVPQCSQWIGEQILKAGLI